jgi:hypothetical protein
VDAFRQEILPIRYFKPVTDIYHNPAVDMTDVLPRTRWGLHNAFTRCVRQMAPAPAFAATTALGQFALYALVEDRAALLVVGAPATPPARPSRVL